MPGSIDNLDPADRFEEFLQATHLNKGVASQDTDGDDVRAKSSNRVISFGCTKSGMAITIKPGRCYFKGVRKSCSIATNPVTIAATSYGYYSINLTSGTFTWSVSTSDPGDGDDDTEIWLVFIATVVDGKITELEECQHGDIRSMGNA
jgi:hypothetical protein